VLRVGHLRTQRSRGIHRSMRHILASTWHEESRSVAEEAFELIPL